MSRLTGQAKEDAVAEVKRLREYQDELIAAYDDGSYQTEENLLEIDELEEQIGELVNKLGFEP